MTIIYPEKLQFYLLNKNYSCYILLGNEIILLQESINQIIKKEKKPLEKYSVLLKKNSDWKKVFLICSKQNLFSKKKVILVNIHKDLILNKNNSFFNKFTDLLNLNIKLIIHFDKFISNNQQLKIFSNLKLEVIIVNCTLFNKTRLTEWITANLKRKNIKLDEPSQKILAEYYYGNLVELVQILNILYLIWPNKHVNKNQLKEIIEDSSNASMFQWNDFILSGNIKESLRILRQLYLKKVNPLYLIRMLQESLINLISMKRNRDSTASVFLHNKNIWKNRHFIFTNACKNSDENQIYKIIKLITSIEISIKKNINLNIWNKLKNLSFMFLKKTSK